MLSKLVLKNFFANVIGQFIYPILSILLVPFYIYHLGLEGYGLVGFFSMLVTLLGVFGDGMGSALQREFARRDGVEGKRSSMRQLLQTIELLYWGIGLFVGFCLILFSSLVDTKIVNTQVISDETVRICLQFISISIAIRFPLSVYHAVFYGMQEQVLANILNGIFALLQAIVGAIVVWTWKSVVAFYISNVLVALLQVFVIQFWSHKILPSPNSQDQPRYVWSELRRFWNISLDLIWTNGIGLLITQTDRLVIARLMPVASLGIYTVSTSGGQLLSLSYGPFLAASYPELCQQAVLDDQGAFDRSIVRNAKFVMAIGMAVGIPISLFTQEILKIWTQNDTVVQQGFEAMSIYIYGNLLISYATVLYQGLMALGHTRYGLWFNLAAIIWFPVTMWLLVSRLGLVGAALTWLIYCLIGWLFNLFVFLMVHSSQILLPYIKVIVQTSVIGIPISLLSRYCADYFYPEFAWGRLLIGALGGSIIGLACMLVGFGFGFPKEILRILRKEATV